MHAVIFAGGALRPGKAVDAAIATADLIIAADSGAQAALALGITPAITVGDFDSLTIPLEELKKRGSRLIRVAAEKDETDTELAIEMAIQQGASHVTLLGALGGSRFEHTIANIMLLAGYKTFPIRIIDGPSVGWMLHGPGNTVIIGQRGDLISLLPLTGEATGIQTTHLYYPLRNETLCFGKSRGISNILTSTQAEISLEHGLLLIIHTSLHELNEPPPPAL